MGGCFCFVSGGGGEDGFDEVDAGFDAVVQPRPSESLLKGERVTH